MMTCGEWSCASTQMLASASACSFKGQIAPVIDIVAESEVSCRQRARPPWRSTAILSRSVMEYHLSMKCSPRKARAKHWETALGLLPSRLVLNHIPMFHEDSILDSKNVRRDPIGRCAETRESAMHDHEISVSHNDARLIPECWRQSF